MSLGDIATIIGVLFTILSLGVGTYVGIIKTNTTLKTDLQNGFIKLKEFEDRVLKDVENLAGRLDKKQVKIDTLEKMLYKYLKKAEAEAIYCKKEAIDITVKNLNRNQELLYNDLKLFRDEFKSSLNTITEALTKHVDEERRFQRDLIEILKENKNG